MPLHTLSQRFPLFFLLCAVMSSAQEKSPSFLIRIFDISCKNHSYISSCTVLTEDGRLRYEVSPVGGKPTLFEGTASDDDVTRLRELVNDANFQSAMQYQNQKFKHHRRIGIVPLGTRVIAVEVKNVDGKLQTVSFAGTDVPSYLAGLISFTTDVSNRNLPNLQGKTEPLCRPFGPPYRGLAH
jgi:hypothetical protein